MERDFRLFLHDILNSIQIISQYTKNITEEDFFNSQQLQDAINRRIEIIGEAVKNIPDFIKKQYPQVAWKSAAGMRDVVAHGYFEVDNTISWETLQKDLPILRQQIEKIMRDVSDSKIKHD